MRTLVGLAAGLFALTLAAAAAANSAGIGNFSGKTGGNCGTCHNTGGAAPTLAFDGPSTLAAGAQGQYTLTVTTTLAKTGADIAGSDGVAFTAGTGLKSSSNDLVQSSPVAPTGGAATYTFTVTAPTAGSSMTLYASGVAADGNGTQTGDGSAVTTKTITVTGGAAAPASSSSSSTSTSSTGDDDDSTTKTTTDARDPWNDTQSCSASRGPSSAGVMAATFLALGLVASTRRRRRR